MHRKSESIKFSSEVFLKVRWVFTAYALTCRAPLLAPHILKMSLCATTCVKVPCFKLSTPLQHPFTPSYTSSHVGSPPSTPSVSPGGSGMDNLVILWYRLTHEPITAASTVSESDNNSFPLTPDSKRSGDTRHVADISCRAGPSTSISRYHKQHHVDSYNYSFHPYRQAPSFQDRCAFECMLGSSDCDNSLEDMKGKVGPPFFFGKHT